MRKTAFLALVNTVAGLLGSYSLPRRYLSHRAQVAPRRVKRVSSNYQAPPRRRLLRRLVQAGPFSVLICLR
jgi:hypothetical protein